MSRSLIFSTFLLFALLFTSFVFGVEPGAETAVMVSANADVAGSSALEDRGEYLVHFVAMCVQCHSPRDSRGRLLEDRLFQGGPIPFKNPWAGARWAFQAPNIANLPGYTEDELIMLLGSGIRRTGDRPAAPMPQYRMSTQDAVAIWTYLKSPRLGNASSH